jgi:hypothetical protein
MLKTQNGTCPLCNKSDIQTEMIRINKHQFVTLNKWYPEQLRNDNEWVHRNCLSHLGLYPIPRGRINFKEMIGNQVLQRIKEIIAEHDIVRGARQLINVVYPELCDEFKLSTEESRRQMRYLVACWITHYLAAERGGVSVEADMQGIVTIGDTETIEEIDPGFQMQTINVTKTEGNTIRYMINPTELLRTPPENLKPMVEYMKVFGDTQIQILMAIKAANESEVAKNHSEIAKLEAEIAREKQKTHGTEKTPRTAAVLDAHQPRWIEPRYSISHTVLHKLYAEEEQDSVPPLPRVFTVVYDWFTEHNGKVGMCPLNVKIIEIAGVPVVYGLQRFSGTEEEHRLLQHVRNTLFPRPFIDAPAFQLDESTSKTDQDVPQTFPGPCMAPELQPVSAELQLADIRCLCKLLTMSPEDWPSQPDEEVEVGKPPAALIGAWSGIKDTQTLGIGEWLTRLGSSTPSRDWLYTLAVLMHSGLYVRIMKPCVVYATESARPCSCMQPCMCHLDGWNSDTHMLIGRRGYLKTAVPFIRRVLIATRDITHTHPLTLRLNLLTTQMK